ncbi:hypothetical protein NDU88_000893 [Pleurodeles waltl]|uniref:Uncharacterized protein n=1 Tax=Pleurodeles waltl TaxID=8319 RepID=A0AAV7U5A6_PLEWA|nr:hypothetical protein NDU88_000893 [Pleurodeles waltl]
MKCPSQWPLGTIKVPGIAVVWKVGAPGRVPGVLSPAPLLLGQTPHSPGLSAAGGRSRDRPRHEVLSAISVYSLHPTLGPGRGSGGGGAGAPLPGRRCPSQARDPGRWASGQLRGSASE